MADHDLRELAWWTIATVLGGSLEPPRASIVATLIRILASLGEDPGSEVETWERLALGARLDDHLPPRDEAEWALAERILDPETLAEVRRWRPQLQIGPIP